MKLRFKTALIDPAKEFPRPVSAFHSDAESGKEWARLQLKRNGTTTASVMMWEMKDELQKTWTLNDFVNADEDAPVKKATQKQNTTKKED